MEPNVLQCSESSAAKEVWLGAGLQMLINFLGTLETGLLQRVPGVHALLAVARVGRKEASFAPLHLPCWVKFGNAKTL